MKRILHSDNGSAMKGATLKATLERLGVLTSYSRPSVNDDNPYVESLFGTMKARVGYPKKPFESLTAEQQWVDSFVRWYNHEHRHSALNWVAPMARHAGEDASCCAAASNRSDERGYAIQNRHPVASVPVTLGLRLSLARSTIFTPAELPFPSHVTNAGRDAIAGWVMVRH